MTREYRPAILFARAALALAFIASIILVTDVTPFTFTMLAGGYLFVDGVSALYVRPPQAGGFAWTRYSGIVGILAGAWIFLNPGMPALALALVVGGWCVVLGGLEMAGALKAHSLSPGMRAFLALAGSCNVLLGALFFLEPWIALFTHVTLLAAFALLTAASSISLGTEARHIREKTPEAEEKKAA